jgi:DNA-binding MarR family transcriptional regulator
MDISDCETHSESHKVNFRLFVDNRLNITNPSQGEIISGIITIEWTLESTLLDNSTHFQIYYSPDDGNNWIILTSYTMNTSYLWNTEIFEEHNTHCRIQISYESKYQENFQVVSGRFSIDNRSVIIPEDILTFFVILAFLVIIGVFLWNVRPSYLDKPIFQVIQSKKHDWLTELSHKVIIGVDTIKSDFVEELPQVPDIETVSLSASIADLFPQNIRHDLQYRMKGRTVLTLIEIAYLGPNETTPTKISKSLNIPLSTLSKEIKKLEYYGYVETSLTPQMLQDARVKNFAITKKGYQLLLNLDTVIKIAIDRIN